MNRINTHKGLSLLFLPLILLLGCEQDTTATSPGASSRVTLQPNEHNKQMGDYMIHVNALTTDQLPTEVAKGYQITRSKNRAMLNVSVRQKQDGVEIPVPAKVKVIAKNLNNQLKDFDVREIRETDPAAIYYIGQVQVNHEETLVFDIDLTPEGSSETILLSYRQRFFTQ